MKGQSSSQEGKAKGGRRNVTSQGRMKDEGCSQVKGRVEGLIDSLCAQCCTSKAKQPTKS